MNIFLFFCQQCAGNPSEDGNVFRFQYVPVTKTVPKQKRRSGEEYYFNTDLPGNNRYRSLDKAEESEKIQKDPEGTNSITCLCVKAAPVRKRVCDLCVKVSACKRVCV